MAPFVSPQVSLDPAVVLGIQTLPALVDFHGENNPQHPFCLQVKGDNRSVQVSYQSLQHAIVRCQAWLGEQVVGFHPPIVDADGHVKKCAPVAILMESHVGLAIYVLACMGKGIPVVLLSARLSAPAVRHLIRETDAKLILISPRLQALASEAFPAIENDTIKNDEEKNNIVIRLVAEYEALLETEVTSNASQLTTCTAHPSHFVSEEDRQVIILHSSGTSGLPKPIPCSHRYFMGYATCHNFNSDKEAQGLTLSTLPFFHGFGFVSICMSLGIGKTICIPPPSMIPNGASTAALIQDFKTKALLTVPSILEEIESLPENKGHEVLRTLDFVACGGGMPKESVGKRLESAGVRLITQYGATETGPMTPFFVPGKGYDWRQLRLRSDTLGPLQVELDRVDKDIDERTYTYKLSMRPFGWKKRFELQDLIVTKRECSSDCDIGQLDFSIAGRTDDLICLATGEKVRPTILESLLNQHEDVKVATAFGDQQFELGVIVETVKTIDLDKVENFKASIWPIIEEAGRQMDAHARIMSPAAILVVRPGALPRSDKGTILRNAVAKKFAKEIASVYGNLEANVDAPPFDLSSPRSSIRALLTEKIKWQAFGDDLLDDDDFFARGMDSLQATRLRRFLTASVRATHIAFGFEAEHVLPVDKITDGFVYLNPSISMLVEALIPKHRMVNGIVPETKLIEQLVEKYTDRGDHGGQQQKKAVVVLTGATGSLGSFFLEQLLMNDSVGCIICLNRPGKENPIEAQKHAMRSRDISVSNDMWAKVEIRQTSTAAPCLGLKEPEYERLATEVTHIVHIAWPMNFKMGIRSFDSSFRSLQNLIQLARKAHFYHRSTKPRILFISSISTIGNYPSIQGRVLVPEVTVENPTWTLELGYAKAKLVCEKMIQHAINNYPEIEAGLIRVGQIAGAISGYWNVNEHFVALCASSQKIGKFPDLRGTLSWLPVDSAAKAIAEILLHDLPLQQVYHLENPVRQSWEAVVKLISKELRIPSSSIIPLQAWLDLVASAPGPGNPAASLIQFLRNDFLKMSCGSIVLDTSNSRNVSSVMANMRPVGENAIEAHISYWRRMRILK